MTLARAGFCLAALAVLAFIGCGNGNVPQAQAGGQAQAGDQTQAAPVARPAAAPKPIAETGVEIDELGLGEGVKILLEAESGKIEEPMKIHADATPAPGVDGPKGASGGKYVETAEPVETDPQTGKRKELFGGSTTLTFSVPKDGKYYVWLRVWWRHSCANCFSVRPDNDENIDDKITDNTFAKWHWVAVGKSIFDPAPFEFKKGQHTLKITSREDGSVLDQVLVVDDPDHRP